MVLIEVKDPSASRAPESEREKFSRKMQTKELTHEELVPKARSSYSFLHLMKRDSSPMRLVVVIGTERLSIQPPLLMNLTDRLRQRLDKEIDEPWKRKYVADCAVIPVKDLGKVLPGCSARRIDPTTS